MKTGNKAVFGIYADQSSVEYAVQKLKQESFRNSDISVLMADPRGTQEFAHEKQTKAPEGATAGSATGAVIGGTLGWLAGVGALAIPGFGPFIAAGPIMGALAGAGVGGTVGGISGWLIGLGLPEYEAKRYEGYIKDGGILLSVHVDDPEWSKKAERILKETGARGIGGETEVPGVTRDHYFSENQKRSSPGMEDTG